MTRIQELYTIIDATIGPEANKDDPLYMTSEMRQLWFACHVGFKALNNGRPGIARRRAIWVAQQLAEGQFFDATDTLRQFSSQLYGATF